MSKADLLDLSGVVSKVLPGAKYEVSVKKDGTTEPLVVTCHLSGKMRKNNITIVLGDMVDIAVSPYDLTRGKINWRYAK